MKKMYFLLYTFVLWIFHAILSLCALKIIPYFSSQTQDVWNKQLDQEIVQDFKYMC